jgi:HAD superfamily hydrolase (TIGR01493 family)
VSTAIRRVRQVPFDAVLFDFSGTLFHIETAAEALEAALGPEFVSWAPALERWGAINGSRTPDELPPHLADVWERRDLDHAAHRAAYSGLSRHAGLTQEQADRVYDRGTTPQAWRPFPDTAPVLHQLHEARTPVAVVSNIGWDPRPVIAAYGLTEYLPVLVLSDERGVLKPDRRIFELALDELGAEANRTVMVGDNAEADGAAAELGCTFELVSPSPDRPADALLRAVSEP